eukprot:1195110-Prorocentrum_minimum.AAC.6
MVYHHRSSMKFALCACVLLLFPMAEGFNALKHHTAARALFLALEMVENRCPSQTGPFIQGHHTQFNFVDVDTASGRKLTLAIPSQLKIDSLATCSKRCSRRLSHFSTTVLSSQLGMSANQDAAGFMNKKIGVCSSAAQMVDEACQGAPDDRGAAAVTNWLQGLACVSAGP